MARYHVWKFKHRYDLLYCADVYRNLDAAMHDAQAWAESHPSGFVEIQFTWV